MLDLTPPLSVTVAPLVARTGDLTRAVALAAEAGYHAVQLSAALRGIRPRELGHRARRDVLAMLSRHGVTLSGLDLMIPHRDWLQPDRQDRALHATLAAIDLAADWGKLPLAITLPLPRLDAEIEHELLTAADAGGVPLAVHAEHDVPALLDWLGRHDLPVLGAGLDPAALLADDADVPDAAVRLSRFLRVARLDDFRSGSTLGAGGRCPLGQGLLDVTGYQASLAVCEKLRSLVVELRELPDPAAAMRTARQAWQPHEA